MKGFVVPLDVAWGPLLLDQLRIGEWLPVAELWWFAMAEDDLVLPSRCTDPAAVFARTWDRVSLFGPRAELRRLARGRGGEVLLLTEGEAPPELPVKHRAALQFDAFESGIHVLWGEKQHLGKQPAVRGQVGFPRPLDYLPAESEALQDALVLDVYVYTDPTGQPQERRYAGLRHVPHGEWEKKYAAVPFEAALQAANLDS
jgi:hypothetical protein